MTVDEIVAKLPEEVRGEAKAELSAYVKLGSKEDAAKLAQSNDLIKSAFDREIEAAVRRHDEKFKAEALPSIIESEIAKRNPPKDPKDQKISELEQRFKDLETKAARESQKSRAMKALTEKGYPVALAEKVAGLTDADTDSAIAFFEEILSPWKQGIEKSKAEELVKGSTPRAGKPGGKVLSESELLKMSGPDQAKFFAEGGTVGE